MYTNLYSMILSHIALQNYFENFSKFKKFPIIYPVSGLSVDRAGRPIHSRPDRLTGPVDRALWSGRAHLCKSVGRPTGRPTGSTLLSGFCRSTGPVDRQNKEKIFFGFRSTESNGYFANWTAGRPDRSTDSRLQPPTASFLSFCIGIRWRFLCQLILKSWQLFSDLIT